MRQGVTVRFGVPGPAETVAFWCAIVLPVLYLPLLATGLTTPVDVAGFLGLVAVNCCLFVVGRHHART